MPTYTFRTGKGDEDIDDILSRVPISTRSWFLKEAVRFRVEMGDELKKLNQNIESLLGGGGAARSPAEEQPTEDTMDDLLMMGIAHILK
ncbi:MAG: hypothetical protein DDT34_02116 [Firmicutes bacterium]|nr:hypothetical protein [Bacillota bacterium]